MRKMGMNVGALAYDSLQTKQSMVESITNRLMNLPPSFLSAKQTEDSIATPKGVPLAKLVGNEDFPLSKDKWPKNLGPLPKGDIQKYFAIQQKTGKAGGIGAVPGVAGNLSPLVNDMGLQITIVYLIVF
jgi:hypothetical protein